MVVVAWRLQPLTFLGAMLGRCLRLVPGATGGAGVDAAGAVAEGLVLGAAAGAQGGPGLGQRPLGGVQDKIAADQQRPAAVRGDDGRMGWFLGSAASRR
jgi:hypothetical protein